MLTSIVCYVCSKQIPKEFAHEHHERPQAVGGTDKDIILLCSSCHTNTHVVSNMLRNGKASLAMEAIRSFPDYSKSVKAQKRCMELAIEVTKWFQLKAAGKVDKDPNEEIEVVIRLPIKLRNALQSEADGMRHPKSGRKLGMTKLAAIIISEWLMKKYPKLKF